MLGHGVQKPIYYSTFYIYSLILYYEGGPSHYRVQFEELTDNVVNWCPYVDYVRNHIHARGHRDMPLWFCRVYCIHFWMVEYHMPDRVMRQLGLFQTVPPPDPIEWDVIEDLREWEHSGGTDLPSDVDSNWGNQHSEYINAAPISINEQRGFDVTRTQVYDQWFYNNGMFSVYQRDNNDVALRHPVNPPPRPVEDLAYVPHGQHKARLVSNSHPYS